MVAEVKKKMNKTKTIFLLIIASLVIMAAVGVAYGQIVNSQNQNSTYNPNPNQAYNGNYGYLPPNAGNGYAQIPPQNINPPRMGMGMCGRYW
jgi:hypothetical protein